MVDRPTCSGPRCDQPAAITGGDLCTICWARTHLAQEKRERKAQRKGATPYAKQNTSPEAQSRRDAVTADILHGPLEPVMEIVTDRAGAPKRNKQGREITRQVVDAHGEPVFERSGDGRLAALERDKQKRAEGLVAYEQHLIDFGLADDPDHAPQVLEGEPEGAEPSRPAEEE